MKPAGQVGHGFVAPSAYEFGRNCCSRLVPCVPRYEAVTVSDAGRSRWTDAFQLWAAPTRRFGSTAYVLIASSGAAAWNALASVTGLAALFSTLNVRDSGGCCASSVAID